jgi:hypothetical protein
LAHTSEQHSVDDWQPPPVGEHVLMDAAQVLLAGSQIAEQQSSPVMHVWPKARQKGEGAGTSVPCPPTSLLPPSLGLLSVPLLLLHAANANIPTRNTLVRALEFDIVPSYWLLGVSREETRAVKAYHGPRLAGRSLRSTTEVTLPANCLRVGAHGVYKPRRP